MTKFARDVEVAVEVNVSLNCSFPGCGSAWSVNLEGGHCSRHQWGKIQTYKSAANSPFATQDFGADGKGWARRIRARQAAGEWVSLNNVRMANQALEREPNGTSSEV